MPNFDLTNLHNEYNTKNIRVLISRMLKQHPEYAAHTIVMYSVRNSGGIRLQVCMTRDEVRQCFLSPHCMDAKTIRKPDVAASDAA